jgi:arabinan endo-1,5-alpha-L-arabinosidase
MNMGCFLSRFAMAALALGALALRADDPPAPTFANVTVHDPSVVRDGSTFYVFGSHMASASTTDLLRWTQITTSAAYPNSLIRNQAPLTEFSEALTYAGGATTFWAPDVIRLGDGKYYFYYCACQGSSPLSALGLAKADAVTGPYANVTILLKSSGSTPTVQPYDVNTMPNVVDPSVFFDQTGRLWMVYGSFSGGIFILRLDSTVGSPTIGQPISGQGYGKKLIGGNSSRIEGPYIIYSPETSYYYLFMTFGGLDAAGGYNVRVGRSRNPDGPYLDSAGNDLTNVMGSITDDTLIAPYGVKLMGNWQFLHVSGETLSTSRGYVSPGGCSVYRDPATGQYFLVFHTRFVGSGEVHEVRVHQFYFNTDGWPVVAPHRYARETIGATDAGRIVGNYKLINHGKDITATVKTSSVIALNFDGSVTGAATGTWLLSGEHDVTLTLSGVTYRGVFARQWDDDNQTWVLTFTALSGNGTAIWGSKVTINTTPAILTQPASHTVQAGMSVSFSTLVSGDPAPTYQWRKNGVDIAGATSATFTITNAAATDAGNYAVAVTNAAGTAVSNSATLTVQTGSGYTVSTLAGQAAASGGADGTGSAARFSSPADVAVDSAGSLYAADTYNNSIRKITSVGVVSTVATGFNHPSGVAVDGSGNLYVADTDNNSIRKITSAGVVSILATGFNGPSGIAADTAGNVYVAETLSHTIRKVSSSGAVTLVAGTAGSSGSADGTGSAGSFYGPQGLALDSSGNLYVADTNNDTIRKVVVSTGAVTTVAGQAGASGNLNGTGSQARFYFPSGVAVDTAGNLFVADTDNSTIREITSSGVVSTLAGQPGTTGSADGVDSAARFNFPAGITVSSSGTIYVADTNNHTIRALILPVAPGVTTQPQSQSVTVGASVQFSVTATGNPAPTYQWNLNGAAISGATSSSLSLTNVQTTSAGTYTVTVTNSSGSLTSSGATLTVNTASTPSPAPSEGGGGGGGGGVEPWLVAALALLGAARWTVRRDR